MGYILLLIIGVAVLIGLFVMFAGRSKPAGQTAPADDVTHKKPAADEPTPTESTTTNTTQAAAAEKKIPPA